jgi:hypothetical protein
MTDRNHYLPEDRTAWLLTIGRRLRAEYDAIAEPCLRVSPHSLNSSQCLSERAVKTSISPLYLRTMTARYTL